MKLICWGQAVSARELEPRRAGAAVAVVADPVQVLLGGKGHIVTVWPIFCSVHLENI